MYSSFEHLPGVQVYVCTCILSTLPSASTKIQLASLNNSLHVDTCAVCCTKYMYSTPHDTRVVYKGHRSWLMYYAYKILVQMMVVLKNVVPGMPLSGLLTMLDFDLSRNGRLTGNIFPPYTLPILWKHPQLNTAYTCFSLLEFLTLPAIIMLLTNTTPVLDMHCYFAAMLLLYISFACCLSCFFTVSTSTPPEPLLTWLIMWVSPCTK